jgi:hypothetical protein
MDLNQNSQPLYRNTIGLSFLVYHTNKTAHMSGFIMKLAFYRKCLQ